MLCCVYFHHWCTAIFGNFYHHKNANVFHHITKVFYRSLKDPEFYYAVETNIHPPFKQQTKMGATKWLKIVITQYCNQLRLPWWRKIQILQDSCRFSEKKNMIFESSLLKKWSLEESCSWHNLLKNFATSSKKRLISIISPWLVFL